MISAHVDDFAVDSAGTGIKFRQNGGRVKFIAATMSEFGSPFRSGGEYARFRADCCLEVEEKFDMSMETWNWHDGEAGYSLDARHKVLQAIREFEPDIIVCPHTFIAHPDLRNVSNLVSDASFFATMPNMLPIVPAMKKMPLVFNIWSPTIHRATPFVVDVAIAVDDVFEDIMAMAAIHGGSMYEWVTPASGDPNDLLKMSQEEALAWYRKDVVEPAYMQRADIGREKLIERYGEEKGKNVKYAELFQVTGYASELPSKEELLKIFPF